MGNRETVIHQPSHNTPFDYFYTGDQNSSGVRQGRLDWKVEGGTQHSTLHTWLPRRKVAGEEKDKLSHKILRGGVGAGLTGTISSGWFPPAQPRGRGERSPLVWPAGRTHSVVTSPHGGQQPAVSAGTGGAARARLSLKPLSTLTCNSNSQSVSRTVAT